MNRFFSFSFSFHELFHNQVIKFTGELKSLKYPEGVKISDIFHCKGLLLCTTEDNRLVLWNPCTGQTRWIQSEPYYPRCYLGYENNNKSCDSYKILSCSYYYRGNIRAGKYEIYEFNSDSWRVLDAISDYWPYLWHDLAISLKEDTYWLNSKTNENPSIVRFDFTTERFERLPLPSSSDEHNEYVVISTVREEKLALLCQYSDSTGSIKMKIWVTDTKTDEAKDLLWSEFLVCKVVIYGMTRIKSYLVDAENKKVLCCYTDDDYRTRIYIVGEDTYKNVYIEVLQEPRSRVAPRLFSYFPSLVQIPMSEESLLQNKRPQKKKKIWLILLNYTILYDDPGEFCIFMCKYQKNEEKKTKE
ncbi:putative F-box/kelch-repeat protein [Raphanus sativus]|nr:putative F-box/kelch-repeat protein [Raphanus sativus]